MRRWLAICLWSLPLLGQGEDVMDEYEPIALDGSRLGWQVDGSQREAVRLFYSVRYPSPAVADFWQGSLADCQPGETLPAHRLATLRRINWYRAMAGLPADLREDLAATPKAQAAALAAAANGRISHELGPDWRCATPEAQQGARFSAMALGVNGAQAVDAFMRDAGAQNVGANHRRWLLYPQTMRIGVGDVDGPTPAQRASAFTAFDEMYSGNRPPLARDFVAWPPPGWVPYPVVFARWSLSLPQADFSAARVSMLRDGVPVQVQQEAPSTAAGEPTLVWLAEGLGDDASWPRPARDTRYQVRVEQIRQGEAERQIEYEVMVFDPDTAHASRHEARVLGPAQTALSGARFSVPALPGATGQQWRALRVTAWAPQDGAEAGLGNWRYQGAGGYATLSTRQPGVDLQSFRLAHRHMGDEVLELADSPVLGAAAALTFRSRLGIAGADEQALVEIRPEGQAHWTVLTTQRSAGESRAVDALWREQRIDLRDYAQRRVQLRFRYRFDHGAFYSPEDGRVGWFLDDIRLEDAFRVLASTEAARVEAGQFLFAPDQPGAWRLQARPLVYRAAGEWGPLWPVQVD